MHNPDFVNAEEKDVEDEDDDDDFVRQRPPRVISKTPQAKSRRNKETTKNKKANQPEVQQYHQYYEFTRKKMLPRIALSNLINCFANFNEDQKRKVNDMGFKPVLNLKLDSIPTELAFWMVQNYNAYTSTLNVGTRLIHITPEVVHRVMGIPLGTIPIEEKRPSGKDAVVVEWRSFYKNTIWIKRLFVLEFFRRVSEMQHSGRKFILNFLLVVVNDIRERMKRESDQHTLEWVCKKHLKNIENYMRPGRETEAQKKSKSLKIKTKKESGKTILEDNLDSNTKQLVVEEQDDGYDAEEEEEYLAICNEYKENEEHDFMISESRNHLILLQFHKFG
ncbi:hypothetical protein L1987_20292 [Smallanthus sonchifolius]|uniref:Uncharacterized protein n=1 Tax=Smallanthus sonchifolius TaxID=185202 RepID=A0ACB9IT42_9ASTR|nr:hypothetical protein L1987_20292 [Smallanthus sonchifolius]